MINIQITIEWIHKLNNMKVDKKLYLFVKTAIVWYLHILDIKPFIFSIHSTVSSTVVAEDIYYLCTIYYQRCSTETVRCTGIISFSKRFKSVEIEGQDTKYLILIVGAMLHIS